jgi:hypothetical protein
MRVYNAIVLVDEPAGRHFATFVELQIKTIETRMRDIIPEGEIVICCSSKSMTRNRCKAICIVTVGKSRPMVNDDETKACIECVNGRIAYPLSDWKYFSRKFTFSKRKVSGTFQGIFQISIPDDVEIIKGIEYSKIK